MLDRFVQIRLGRITHAISVVFEQHGEIRGDVGVIGIERARLLIRGERAGAIEAIAEAAPDGVVLQHPAQRLPRERGFGLELRRGQRLALRARAEACLEQRRARAQPVHGLARIFRDQLVIGAAARP